MKDEPKKPAAADRPVSVRIKRCSKPALVVKRNIVTENIVAVTHKKTVVFQRKSTKLSTYEKVYHSKFILWKYNFCIFLRILMHARRNPYWRDINRLMQSRRRYLLYILLSCQKVYKTLLFYVFFPCTV